MTSKTIYPHVPYFYIIQHVPSGKFYVGCKYSKRKTHPELLLKEYGYKTSSKTVQELIKQDGLSSFVICDIITEDEIKVPFGFADILHFETWYLTTNKIAQNKNYLNRCNNAPQSPQLYGTAIYVTPEGNKRLPTILGKKLGYTTPRKGQKNSPEANRNISMSLKGISAGEKNPMYGARREDLAAYNRDPINAARKGLEYSEFITKQFLKDLDLSKAEFILLLTDTRKFHQGLNFEQFFRKLKEIHPNFSKFLSKRLKTQMKKLTPDLL